MAISNGSLPPVVSEALWFLPSALNAGCQGTLSSFLVMVHRASADRLMKPNLLYKKAAVIGGVQMILALSSFTSAVVYVHFYPQNGRWSYLISGLPVALIHLTFISHTPPQRSSRFRRKIWISIRFSLLYQLIWLMSFIVYASSYYVVTSITSPAAWMTLVLFQLFDPQAWFIVLFIVPRLSVRPVYVPGPPKRFAQFCGLICCGASLVLYVTGQRVAAFWLLGVLLVLSFVQARHGICVGCFIWHLFSLMGFMSEELVVKSTAAFQVQDIKMSAIPLTAKSHTSST
ncbi:hypothetical protein PROFUN_06460 [Planoprotostelium fungivorum]|uniref:DUF4395 domain-containing protein n=1 Tax=Planoprotostelium fungivorum TaxID=1890364 RepID=A0A2P6MR10_9EUKA|nr:hypothetical protein PROFUN_06460 [Planoprotostelium fungivorum]